MSLLLIGVWHLFLIWGTNPQGILVRWVVEWDVTGEGAISKSSGSICSATASVGVPVLLWWTCFIFCKHLSNQLILQLNGLVLTANHAFRRVAKEVEVILPGWEESCLPLHCHQAQSPSLGLSELAACTHAVKHDSFPPSNELGLSWTVRWIFMACSFFSWCFSVQKEKRIACLMSVSRCCVWTTCVFLWSFEYLKGKIVIGTLWS